MARVRALQPETDRHSVSMTVSWAELREDEYGTKARLDEFRRSHGVPDDIAPSCTSVTKITERGGSYVYTWTWYTESPDPREALTW